MTAPADSLSALAHDMADRGSHLLYTTSLAEVTGAAMG